MTAHHAAPPRQHSLGLIAGLIAAGLVGAAIVVAVALRGGDDKPVATPAPPDPPPIETKRPEPTKVEEHVVDKAPEPQPVKQITPPKREKPRGQQKGSAAGKPLHTVNGSPYETELK